MGLFRLASLLVLVSLGVGAQKAPTPDALGRTNPRSTITDFLEACHRDNYSLAAQYFDLRSQSARAAKDARQIAKTLESILNSDPHLDILRISQAPQGNVADDPNPNVEHIAQTVQGGRQIDIDLQRVTLSAGSEPVWLFAPRTVSELANVGPDLSVSGFAFESHLPGFLVHTEIFESPLWKWLALLLAAIILAGLARLISRLGSRSANRFRSHLRGLSWLAAILEPMLVVAAAVAFRIIEELVAPATLSRVYIGDFILLVVVFAFSWLLINLVELFLFRVDSLLDPRQRQVSHSLLYLGRRTARIVIFIVAAIFVLNNWGYPMTTIIAGLGVSGIAVALAAQQTIANVFGGVSVIGDHPVMVGDFGNFGGVIGTVADIGMRSTRVRTLNRTVVSIPNSSFAGMNLENYSLRDKILFNPTLQVKRTATDAQVRKGMEDIAGLLHRDSRVEIGPAPVRISSLSAASYAMEVFAYVQTSNIDEYYKIEADLFMALNACIAGAGLELV